MCQQTPTVAADERCSQDDSNQMFQGTSAETAAGFWGGGDPVIRRLSAAAAAAGLGGLITSEMS